MTHSHRMRVGVLGAGSIGAYLGGLLLLSPACQDAELVFIGRRETLHEEFMRDGLTISDLTGFRTNIPGRRFKYSTNVRALESCDYIFFAVKATATESLGSLLHELNWPKGNPVVISLQNGVRNAQLLRALLPHFTVLASVIDFNVVRVSDTHFHRSTDASLVLEQDTSSPNAAHAPLTAALRAMIPVIVAPSIVPIQWGKLLVNLANSVNAMAGIPFKRQLRDPVFRDITASLMEEGLTVLRAAQIEPVSTNPLRKPWLLPHLLRLPTSLFFLLLRSNLKMDDTITLSMAQDLERGLPTEVESINGEIVRLGIRLNIPTPYNSAMKALITKAETARAGSPKLTSAQLAQAIKLRPNSYTTRVIAGTRRMLTECHLQGLLRFVVIAAVMIWLLLVFLYWADLSATLTRMKK